MFTTLIAATLTVLTTAPLSSETAKMGDPVTLITSDGLQAHGSVVHVEKRSKRAQDGKLTISVRYITAADGSRIYCDGTYSARGRTGIPGEIAALGAAGMFIKGKHAVISSGTSFTCALDTQ